MREWSTLRKLMLLKGSTGVPISEYTATGNPVTFNTNIAKPLKSLLLPWTPTQSGTGDPSPSNVRPITGTSAVTVWHTGKNLFDESYPDINDTTKYRAIYVGDCTVTISTTAVRYGGSAAPLFLLPGNVNTGGSTSSNGVWQGQTRTTTAVDGYITIGYRYTSYGDSINPTKNHTMIEVGTQATSYEPYIGTSIPVTFPAVGKNLLPNKTYVYGNNLIVGNDENTANISLKAGTYTFSVYSSKAVALIYQPDGGDMVNIKASGGSTGLRSASFTLQEDTVCKFLLYISGGVAASDVDWFQLEEGTVATPVYEPYTNTVYGGSLDLVTGELTAEYQYLTLGYEVSPKPNNRAGGGYANSNSTGSDGSKAVYIELGWTNTAPEYNKFLADYSKFNTAIMDCRKYVASSSRRTINDFTGIQGTSVDVEGDNLVLLYVNMPSDLDDINKKREYLRDHPMQVCYPLKHPQTWQLTPQQITALIGNNTVWSDANGDVTVTYLKKG